MEIIRRAKSEDISGITRLLEQVLLVHHLGRPDIFKEKGQKYTEEELVEKIADDNNPIFVYEEDGKILGHCFCQTKEQAESTNTYYYKNLYIDDLCVDENVRGKHIGQKLYEHVRNYAKENDYYNLTLHAWECNPKAVGFYEHLGLKIQQYTMEEIL